LINMSSISILGVALKSYPALAGFSSTQDKEITDIATAIILKILFI